MEKKILQSHNNGARFLGRKISRGALRGAALLATAGVLSFGMVSGCGNNGGGGTTTSGVEVKPETVLATVGDTTLNKSEMYALLEANYGASALTQLIDYTLLMQKAKSEGIDITEADVQTALDERAKSNPAMAEAQKKGGAALDALKRQVRLQMAVDRLLTKDVKVDAKAYATWLDKNQSKYAVPERVKMGVLFTSTQARADVLAQQLKSGKSFQDLVKAQKATNDPIAQSSVTDTTENAPKEDPNGGYLGVAELPAEMKEALAKLKNDETSGIIKLAGTRPAFVILKLLDRKAGVPAKGDAPQPQLEYKLEQVSRGLVKENPDNPGFEQTLTQVEQAIQQQGMQSGSFTPPTYRQILDYINQTAVQKLLADLRTSSKVEIKDPMYKEVADNYKAAPTPAGGAVPPAGEAPAGGAPVSEAPAADNAAAPDAEAPAAEAPAAEAPAAEAPAANAPAANAAP